MPKDFITSSLSSDIDFLAYSFSSRAIHTDKIRRAEYSLRARGWHFQRTTIRWIAACGLVWQDQWSHIPLHDLLHVWRQLPAPGDAQERSRNACNGIDGCSVRSVLVLDIPETMRAAPYIKHENCSQCCSIVPRFVFEWVIETKCLANLHRKAPNTKMPGERNESKEKRKWLEINPSECELKQTKTKTKKQKRKRYEAIPFPSPSSLSRCLPSKQLPVV
jgi:hypothetical protein